MDMFCASNLLPDTTGLNNVIWVSYKGNDKYRPRIRVVKRRGYEVSTDNLVSVLISDNPTIFKKGLKAEDEKLVKEFIIKNESILLDYWNGNLSTLAMIKLISKV